MTTPAFAPTHAMILAAGLGLRMRPITISTPKVMVEVDGRTLIDRTLDRFEEAGVETVAVNVHHLADKLERHLLGRAAPKIVFSDERERLLETGGGVKKALPLLDGSNDPFFVANGDALWLDGPTPALSRMAARWNPDEMDGLLLLHATVDAYGYTGLGDFTIDPVGRLERRPETTVVPYMFAGVQILSPKVFEDTPDGPFSLNLVYDRLIERERLFGIVHDGEWFHVGTPDGLDVAENFMRERWPGVARR